MTLSLTVAAFFTFALILYVFAPVREVTTGGTKSRLEYLGERKESIYENLRDLNFENKAGKYPEKDFLEQRSALETEAAAVLAEIDALEKP